MLRPKTTVIDANTTPLISSNTVKVRASSFVYENNWINFEGTLFSVADYINSVMISPRIRFFTNRNYAVCLVVGVSKDGEATVIEGKQVDYTKQTTVPLPIDFNVIPLVGITLIQDGTTDLIHGFKPLSDTSVIFFSSTGNVIDKNKPGDAGPDSNALGLTGGSGVTGRVGGTGVIGSNGCTGYVGRLVPGETGDTGIAGMTGINWTIHIPFRLFI